MAITVRICGQENGLEVYENVEFVRIKSRRYNLLIMKDYLPVLGRIEGSIAFRTEKEVLERNHVRGFFMHKNNAFSLMLGDVRPDSPAVDEDSADSADSEDVS